MQEAMLIMFSWDCLNYIIFTGTSFKNLYKMSLDNTDTAITDIIMI